MTVTINLPLATVEKVRARVGGGGQDLDDFVREAVEAKLVVSGLPFRKILEPIHREVAASGISEEELVALVDGEVAAARADLKLSKKQP